MLKPLWRESSGSITVTCSTCGKPTRTFPSRKLRRKYCGRKCYAAALKLKTGALAPRYGKPHTPESKAKNAASHIALGRVGEAAASWKGGKHISRGYVMVSETLLSERDRNLVRPMLNRSSGRCVPEHRLVMARHLKRALLPAEVVHHRNGIKTDNRLRNLELSDNATHKREHAAILRELRRLRSENERLRSALRRYQTAG